MVVHQKMSEYLASKGIKQRFVSEKTGISEDAISKMLRGERKMTAEEFLLICDVLGVDPKEFRSDAA